MAQKLILCEGRIGNDLLNDAAIAAAVAGGYEVTSASGFTTQDNKLVCAVTLTKPVIAAPLFSPAAVTFEESATVSLSSSTEGASIYYTTDGTTAPTSSATAYNGPFEITATTTIKAIAIKNGVSSAVTSKTYTLEAAASET